jgi:mRNA deadenylase 3'-5' endonuclease subunit Ccr4
MLMFRLMSWNVLADAYIQPRFYPRVDPALLVPAARTQSIIDYLDTSDADVACLQEIEPALVAALEHAGEWRVHFMQKRGKPDGVAVLARRGVVVEGMRGFEFEDGVPDRPNSGCIALIASLRLDEGRCRIATTHIKWDPPETPAAERWAVREVRELLEAIGQVDDCIACGDFNFEPDDLPYVTMIAAGFRDPCTRRPTANANGRAKRIDHLLCGRAVRATATQILSIDDVTPLPSLTMPSDHIPISAVIDGPSDADA